MTFQARRDALATIIATTKLTGAVVFDHIPAPTQTGTVISIDRRGLTWTTTEYRVPVSAYIRASIPSAEDSQHRVDQVIDAMDTAFDNASIEATGAVSYDPATDLWSVDWTVVLYREDF